MTFFLQITDLTLIGPLFTETTKTTQPKSSQCKLSAKAPPFIFYFFMSPLSIFSALQLFENFLIFCYRMYVNKSQRVYLLNFSALCYIFRRKKSVFSQLGKSGFRVFSSMKGSLWVSQNCFLSFS